jgi:hypothetical protein
VRCMMLARRGGAPLPPLLCPLAAVGEPPPGEPPIGEPPVGVSLLVGCRRCWDALPPP